MKKRLLSTLLALCMALTLLPMVSTVGAEEDMWGTPYAVTGGNIYYNYSTEGEIGITGCDPGVTEAIIPSSINGIPVVYISDSAFYECTRLTSVSIPDTVTRIGIGAFLGCTGLTDIKIPDSVEYIGSWAFAECSGLTSITLPDNASDRESTFARCTSVEYFSVSENHKYYSTMDGVLFNKDGTTLVYYPAGNPRETYTIPDGVTYFGATGMGDGVFTECNHLASVIVPDSVTKIGGNAFYDAKGLTSVTLPNSISNIGYHAFSGCDRLQDVYYAGTEVQWQQIDIEEENDSLASATIHYNSTGPDRENSSADEYIYDTPDPSADTTMDANRLGSVTNPAIAAEAVRDMVNGMTQEQKESPTGIDLATLYAETAVAKAASKPMSGPDILISTVTVADVAAEAAQALAAVEEALADGGIVTARELSKTVTLTTNVTSQITIRIDPDVLGTEVDKVRVETPDYALTFKLSDLAPDLTSTLTFKAASANAETLSVKNVVDIEVPGGSMAAPITVSLPTDKSTDTTYQAVVSSTGTTTASKYNPATTNIDGKVNASGTYTVEINEMDFTDITNKSTEMQKAIKYLAAHGIVMGSGGTNYSPNDSISRAELTALVLRALGKVDSKATPTFTDVTTANWYYATAASSQKLGYITGFEDNTFRGTTTINKEQTVVVAARVLGGEMNYKTPSNIATYLSKYSDTVVSWAQPQVALATKENLVVYRTDGTFSGAKDMTRGDAAIIIYRLFQRIW